MDDFNLSTLTESRNEYCALLVNKMTPLIIQGIYSIYNEAKKLCEDNDEDEKYLMTFQNFLGRVPKWNQEIVNTETKRIQETSGCKYLEDLLTCVHVTQLKVLTSVRVGQKQKKIEIDIPKLENFVHQIYIQVARRIYKNVFLFERTAPPLQQQKNMRETELIVKECILDVIRGNMPIETILRSYLDETTEEDYDEIKEEIKEVIEPVEDVIQAQEQEPEKQTVKTSEMDTYEDTMTKNTAEEKTGRKVDMSDIGLDKTQPISNEDSKISPDSESKSTTTVQKMDTIQQEKDDSESLQEALKKSIQFNNVDNIVDYNTKEHPVMVSNTEVKSVEASKDIDNLERISEEKWQQRREEAEEDDEDDEKLQFLEEDSDTKLDFGIESLDTVEKMDASNLVDEDDIIVLQ